MRLRVHALCLATIVAATHAFTPSGISAAHQTTPVELLKAAETLRSQGTGESIRASIPRFEEALQAARTAGDRRLEAAALTGRGRAQDSIGDKRAALTSFTQALELHRANGDGESEANTLNFTGLAQEALGERAEARKSFDAALSRARAIGDRRIEATALNNIGLVNAATGNRRGAVEVYDQALAIYREIGNIRGQATTLTGLGHVYDLLGEKQKALDALNEALPLQRQLADLRGEASTLTNIGAVYFSLDDLTRAVEFYTTALPLFRRAGDPIGEGAALHNLGSVDQQRARYQPAIERYQQALALHRAARYRAGEANTLTNLAQLYDLLGSRDQALEIYAQALALHRAVGNRGSEAITLNSLGNVHLRRGDLGRAAEFYAQALPIMRAAGDRNGEAALAVSAGRIATRRGDDAAAVTEFERALEIYRAIASRRGEAVALGNLAWSQAGSKQTDAAAANFERSVAITREIGQTSAEAASRLLFARFEADRGRLQQAQEHIAAALEVLEGVRAGVTNDDLRMSYFASVQDYYELDIDLAMRRHAADPSGGWVARALATAERARGRALIDMLAESRVDIREGVDAALLDRQRALDRRLRAAADRRTRILSGAHTDAQAAAAAAEVGTIVTSLEDVEAQIRRTSPKYAALTRPSPLSAAEIQRDLLDSGTLLVEYALGASRSFVFVASQSSIEAYELPRRAAIDEAVGEYYRLVQQPEKQAAADAAAGRVASLVITPIARHLASGKRLAVVTTGSLQAIPFAALPSAAGTGRRLLDDHEIVVLPSASVAAVVRRDLAARPAPAKQLLVVADPVFRSDDPRVSSPSSSKPQEPRVADPLARSGDAWNIDNETTDLARLIGSRREAMAIAALLPQAAVRQALDFDAARGLVIGDEPARYRIVHFATHAFVNGAQPDLSGIALSLVDRTGARQDGVVRLRDIFNLRLNADLVVLSACQTALGKDVRGEGLIGLGRGFIHAGAPRVVATAWKVDDAATAELMKRFYEGMFGPERLRPAAALRAAQRAVRQQRRFASPYYWAPFVLQGEWR
jgi:CHAT domain-containing protein/tetratricopeptide (TPR) repeat protein